MGKGIILSNLGEGHYSVEIVYNTARVDAQVTKLTDRIAKFDSQISIVTSQLLVLTQQLQADSGNDALRADVIATRSALNILKLKRMSADKFIEYLQTNKPANRIASIWCADLVDNLAVGLEVGLAEVPNEYGRSNIVPAYFGEHPYSPADHGYLTPAVSMLPTSNYFNRSIFPAWQKFRVRYRYGAITEIDYEADTCSVSLDHATSSEQGLNVNNVSAMSNVPVVYMTCNAAAFEVGDHVQVTFDDHNWQAGTVTGFYSNPKPCQQVEGIKIKINGESCGSRKLVYIASGSNSPVNAWPLPEYTGLLRQSWDEEGLITDANGILIFPPEDRYGANITSNYLRLWARSVDATGGEYSIFDPYVGTYWMFYYRQYTDDGAGGWDTETILYARSSAVLSEFAETEVVNVGGTDYTVGIVDYELYILQMTYRQRGSLNVCTSPYYTPYVPTPFKYAAPAIPAPGISELCPDERVSIGYEPSCRRVYETKVCRLSPPNVADPEGRVHNHAYIDNNLGLPPVSFVTIFDYSDRWTVTPDGHPAEVFNNLFRWDVVMLQTSHSVPYMFF